MRKVKRMIRGHSAYQVHHVRHSQGPSNCSDGIPNVGNTPAMELGIPKFGHILAAGPAPVVVWQKGRHYKIQGVQYSQYVTFQDFLTVVVAYQRLGMVVGWDSEFRNSKHSYLLGHSGRTAKGMTGGHSAHLSGPVHGTLGLSNYSGVLYQRSGIPLLPSEFSEYS